MQTIAYLQTAHDTHCPEIWNSLPRFIHLPACPAHVYAGADHGSHIETNFLLLILRRQQNTVSLLG